MQNTERTDHLLIGALKQFPLDYTFNIVFKGSQVKTWHGSRGMLWLARGLMCPNALQCCSVKMTDMLWRSSELLNYQQQGVTLCLACMQNHDEVTEYIGRILQR